LCSAEPAGPTILGLPAEQLRIDDLIIESRGVGPAGSAEHKSAARGAYEERGGEWDYQTWSSNYDLNQTRAREANLAADRYHQELGWGKREESIEIEINGTSTTRRLDIADKALQKAVEYKTGYQTATLDNLWELERDAVLVQQGWNVEWVFRDRASQPLLDALVQAGIKIKVGG
jgi:hypothetical protein